MTGGYFQPVTVAVGGALAIGLERVTCDLPEASLADARAFQAAYHPNQNPSLVGLSFAAGDEKLAGRMRHASLRCVDRRKIGLRP